MTRFYEHDGICKHDAATALLWRTGDRVATSHGQTDVRQHEASVT